MRGDQVRDAFVRSCVSAAIAFAVGVMGRLVGLDARWTATALLCAVLVGGAYVCYRVLATRLRKRRAGALAIAVIVATAVPGIATLWPGAPFLAANLSSPGEEVRARLPAERAVWILVASNVGHDAAWWGQYEIRVNDVGVVGDLGRVPTFGWRRESLRFRPPHNALRARYHRMKLANPLSTVRLERLSGYVPGGLPVSVFRQPLPGWLAFAAWVVVAVAATVADVRLRFKGALGLAATIPLVVSVMTWRHVTPAAPLEAAFRTVIAGTCLGAFAGYGAARVAALGIPRPLRARGA